MKGIAVTIDRVPTLKPPTARQLEIAARIADNASFDEVARELGVERATIRFHVETLARKIPGDLPYRLRVLAWYRGAPRYVLENSLANARITSGMRLSEALAKSGTTQK